MNLFPVIPNNHTIFSKKENRKFVMADTTLGKNPPDANSDVFPNSIFSTEGK